MSQNPNEGGYFTNLLLSNPQKYRGSSNPSTPSSQNSNPSSPYGAQLTPEAIYLNQQYAFQQGFANQPQRFPSPHFFNPSLPSTFPQSQPQQQFESQPSDSQFKVPQAREPAKSRGKKNDGKKSKKAVDLDADDDDDVEAVGTRVNRKWSKDEEKLLAEIWIEISQDKEIGNDSSEEYFLNQILKVFNLQTDRDPCTKNMITGKWTRINGDCQNFNAVYKHLECRSGENEADHLENAKTNFEQRFGSKSFMYVHVWEVLKNYPKWDAEDPIDITCLEDIFGPDKRPRPERDDARKSRAAKKQKSTDTSSAASSGGSQTSTFSGHLSEKYSQKADVQMAAYEARRQKEVKTLEMEEMKFLMIDPDQTTPKKAAIIRRRQEQIMRKYQMNDEDND